MKKHMYLIESGLLLDENDDEFESYAVCYDKKHGYYDDRQYMVTAEKLNDAIKKEKEWFEFDSICFRGCYIVVTDQGLWENLEEEDLDENETMTDFDVCFVCYDKECVVYSLTKDENGKIIENFIN